jgi:Cdc6-like AAA superfamily ATPase
LSDEEYDRVLRREAEVGEAFSPTAPVDRRDLFSGRTDQIRALIEIVSERGRHGVIYGERGVGKTSLASVGALIVERDDLVAVKVNCAEDDTFDTIWRKALSRITFSRERAVAGFESDPEVERMSAEAYLRPDATSHDLEMAMTQVTRATQVAVFVDEFDRVESPEVHRKMADTIKAFSDQGVRCTVVLVGVADDVGQLVAEHASIERALRQVHMPRMSPEELGDVIDRGLGSLSMTIDPIAKKRIVALSQGLPHYTHLLAQESAKRAVWIDGPDVDEVTRDNVLEGMRKAVEASPQTLTQRYHEATSSPHKKTLYPDVVLAAAVTTGDELGYFAPAQLRQPLRAITGREDLGIPTFSQHLHALCEPDRGSILQRTGTPRRYRFRFSNPLMQPYALMKALGDPDRDENLLQRFLA